MDDAQSRQRGPPPPADERSSTRHPPAGQLGASHREQWQREAERLPLRSRAPLDDDRFSSRKASLNVPGSSSANAGAGPSGSLTAGAHDKRTDNADWAGRGWTDDKDRSKRWTRESGDFHYSRFSGPSGASFEGGGAGDNGPSPYRKRNYNHSGGFAQRSRSQSPPGPSSSTSALPYSGATSSRQRYDHQQVSPPKRPWGGRDTREPFASSSSYADTPFYDRDGPYRGHRGGASTWTERRAAGAAGPPSSVYSSDRSSRIERDGRSRLDESLDRRPFDSSWSRQSKAYGDANGWRDDKGKGPADDSDIRRSSFSRNNQNNPPHPTSSSINGFRARSPESVRSRERRSPSFDDYPLRSPASSTHSYSRLSDRIPQDYERQRNFSQPRLSAPTNQPHPPFNRSNSAGQPAPKRDFDFPPDRPPDALETRLGRSASVSQGDSRRLANGSNGWAGRRRSTSASPNRELVQANEQSSPRSLAERLGPLASVARDLQDRIEPITFRGRTPPPKSPVRQSAPSTLQRSRSPPSSSANAAVVSSNHRSFTPPLPSPARRLAQQANTEIASAAKAGSPSPKLASSPSDAANSSPRPSTTDLEQASSEVTQARTSPDIGRDDESMQDRDEVRETANVNKSAPVKLSGQTNAENQVTSERMPRTPIPLRSSDAVPATNKKIEAEAAQLPNAADVSMSPAEATVEENMSEALKQSPQVENTQDQIVLFPKLEGKEPEMMVDRQDVSPKESQAETAADEDASLKVDSLEMQVDRQELVMTAEAGTNEEAQEPGDSESQAPGEEEATEEDIEAKEFEKSLISFIGTNGAEEKEASVDLSAILEDNKLKAPVSLPVAVNMPSEGQDLLESKPLLLQNHDLLDGWLRETMASRDKRRGEKIFRLRQRYKELDAEWHVHCTKLEKMRERQKKRQNIPIAPPTPSVDSAGISIVPTTPNLLAPSGRSNRRSAASSIGYGDAVRSEAEFLEILASLEDADMRDPNLRAMRTTATVPDQILDESEYTLQQYEDNNGLVTDPFEYYQINKTPDSWTEDEIAIFCRRYALYPKQFGKIAAALPDKTTSQCVLFYYRSKKKIDFRALVDRRNRDGRRKRAKGEKGSAASGKKGPSLLNNIERARGAEVEDEDDDEPQTPGSAMAQESTVLSTARALTQQLNGTSNALVRSEPVKRPSANRAASNKKAARFLSPATERSGTDEGVPPASEGALAAAEALGFLSNIPDEDVNEASSRPNSAKQKKRKPSMSESILNTSIGEDGTPRQVNMAKRSRPHSSSYWSVADKNEFMRLLSVHGKDYVAIAEGIQSKTAVQCKNFFQNNTKKMGLAEIAARAEGEYANISGELGPDSPMEGSEIPSVFGEPDGTALQEPPSGYFIPSHHSKERDAGDYKPYARSGGMHLRNLLDDAPDAEGGAHAQATGGIRMPQDDDSATEDEAEPARYAQESVDARGALRQAHADRAASQQRYVSRNVKEEMLEVDAARHRNHPVEHAHYPSHLRSSSYGSRSEHVEAGHFSPTYLGLAPERGYSMPPRQVYSRTGHAHYDAAVPASGHWAPYEGRSIYGPPTGSGYFHRSRHEEQASHAHHGQEYHHPAFLDSAVHDKAPHRTTFQPHPHLTSSLLAGGAHSPPPQGSHPLRRISDPHAPSIDQAYYERYGPHRPRQ